MLLFSALIPFHPNLGRLEICGGITDAYRSLCTARATQIHPLPQVQKGHELLTRSGSPGSEPGQSPPWCSYQQQGRWQWWRFPMTGWRQSSEGTDTSPPKALVQEGSFHPWPVSPLLLQVLAALTCRASRTTWMGLTCPLATWLPAPLYPSTT